MPGIYGIAPRSAAPDLPDRLARMAAAMRHHPWYVEDRWSDPDGGVALGRLALGVVDPARQPASNEDGSLRAVLTGEVLDPAAHRRALAAAGHRLRGDGHAEILVHGIEQAGPAFLRGLQGSFAAAVWDARRRRLVLVNDRFGMRPLYYAETPGGLLFASEIKALLTDPRVPRRDDLRGIAQFFTFGQLLGEETFFEAVRLLPAAGWLAFDADTGRVELDRYWRLETAPAAGAATDAEHLDRIADAFRGAVDRATAGPGRLGLSLSGGLDSRTILAAADRDRAPMTTVSLGMEGSLDHRCAARMAALAGCPHRRIVLDEAFLADFGRHLDHMVRLTDGHYLDQCIVMPTLPAYRELGVEVLLRGHAGELMHMDKAYNFSLDRAALALRDGAGLESWLLGRLRGFIADPAWGALFAHGLAVEAEDLARRSLRDALRESEGVDPPIHRVWHLFLSQRLRRETALSLAEFHSVVETRLPYLDAELVGALLAAPPGLKLGDRLQAHILRRRMPALLGVVNANTGARLGAGRLGRALARARLKVLAKLGARGYQPYERLGLWLRRELRPLVERTLLDDRCLGRGLFDPRAVRSAVAAHLGGRRNHTYLILALLIFERGRRALLEPEPGARPRDPDPARPQRPAAGPRGAGEPDPEPAPLGGL